MLQIHHAFADGIPDPAQYGLGIMGLPMDDSKALKGASAGHFRGDHQFGGISGEDGEIDRFRRGIDDMLNGFGIRAFPSGHAVRNVN